MSSDTLPDIQRMSAQISSIATGIAQTRGAMPWGVALDVVADRLRRIGCDHDAATILPDNTILCWAPGASEWQFRLTRRVWGRWWKQTPLANCSHAKQYVAYQHLGELLESITKEVQRRLENAAKIGLFLEPVDG